MTLREMLDGVKLAGELPEDVAAIAVAGLEYDSRRVKKDFLFFAFAGSRVDGRRFAQDALARGARAVVSDLPRPDGFVGAWIQAPTNPSGRSAEQPSELQS